MTVSEKRSFRVPPLADDSLDSLGTVRSSCELGFDRTRRRRHRTLPHDRPPSTFAARDDVQHSLCSNPLRQNPGKLLPLRSDTGKLRLSRRRCEWSSLIAPVFNYHRRAHANPDHRVTQVHVGLRQVVFIYEKTAPEPYAPTSTVARDTNESSLDWVRVTPDEVSYVRAVFPEIRVIQFHHVGRRRYLGRRKSHDRRLSLRLQGREGRRERSGVRFRLHEVTRSLVEKLAVDHSALVLEDLKGLPRPQRRSPSRSRSALRSRSFRRRLASWPQGELHRQLAYTTQDRGVPIVWVSPYLTSRTRPKCGEV
jgi:IS605 OrfB family transposase